MSEISFTLSFHLPSSFVRRGALAFACALVCSAVAQEHGRLVGVEAGGDGAASSVELIGDRPLSFTTLKLSGPPRVVVDFAETGISGAPREVAVDDGTIVRVATAPAGQKTARVVIELAGEADFDVRARGSRVEVRVPRLVPLVAKVEPPAGPAAAAAEPANPTASAPEPPKLIAEEQSPPSTAPAAAEPATNPPPAPTTPAIAAEPPKQVPSIATAEALKPAPPAAPAEAPKAAVAAEPSESENEKRASLPTVALVGPRGDSPNPPAAVPVESAAARKRREREERVAAYAAAQRAAAEKVAAARKAARDKRLALAEKAQADKRAAAAKAVADRQARALAAAQAAADKKARTLAAAEKAAADKKARALAAAQAAADKEARALAAAEKTAADKKARALAAAQSAADKKARALAATEKAAAGKKAGARIVAVAESRHAITGIGFRPVGDGQVIVHSNQPLEYGVTGEESAVLVHLEGAAIPLLNNRRPLDTRFFNGPVQRVVPVPVDGGTDLRIEVRGRPVFELAQSGTVLTVTFSASR